MIICICGHTFELADAIYLGIQDGPTFNLLLYNCPSCKTTFSLKADK